MADQDPSLDCDFRSTTLRPGIRILIHPSGEPCRYAVAPKCTKRSANGIHHMSITENIAMVRDRVSESARRVGRRADDIALMAVSKTHFPDRIRKAYAAGLRLFGENRVQEFAGKAGALADLAETEWHMIGQLQTNKAGRAVELFNAFDSVDSVKLAEKLDAAARSRRTKVSVLVEINV